MKQTKALENRGYFSVEIMKDFFLNYDGNAQLPRKRSRLEPLAPVELQDTKNSGEQFKCGHQTTVV